MFWIGKAKKVLKDTISLSPIEILLLTNLRTRHIRSGDEAVGQYGYGIIKNLNDLFAGAWNAQSGTIYPILSRLANEKKLLKSEKRKSPLGPVKKVYNLTDKGIKAIDELMDVSFEDNLNFVVNYLALIAPFIVNIEKDDPDRANELLSRLMSVPAQIFESIVKNSETNVDEQLSQKQLLEFKNSLETVLINIDKELEMSIDTTIVN